MLAEALALRGHGRWTAARPHQALPTDAVLDMLIILGMQLVQHPPYRPSLVLGARCVEMHLGQQAKLHLVKLKHRLQELALHRRRQAVTPHQKTMFHQTQ